MTSDQALAFVRLHGVVLVSAKGPVPNIAEAVAGGPIRGSWWGHPKGREIFRVLENLETSPEILFCRLVDAKVTLVHHRLWPALARVARKFPARQVAQVHQQHTAAGHHVTHEVPFPDWVPPEVTVQARALAEAEALAALGAWAAHY